MSRSDDEWRRLEDSYCRGIDVPPLETVEDYVRAIVCGNAGLINCILVKARQRSSLLVELFGALANVPSPPIDYKNAFYSAWITQGLYLRETFSIDENLPAALANMLPGYAGSTMELFRGERRSNHLVGAYGPAWSSDRSVADMFARRIASDPGGEGVLLRSLVPAAAILAGPERGHLQDEAEYIVDRRGLRDIEVLECYGAVFGGRGGH